MVQLRPEEPENNCMFIRPCSWKRIVSKFFFLHPVLCGASYNLLNIVKILGAACYQSKCQLLLAIFLAVVTVCLAAAKADVMETNLVTGDTIQVIFNSKKDEKTCIFANPYDLPRRHLFSIALSQCPPCITYLTDSPNL